MRTVHVVIAGLLALTACAAPAGSLSPSMSVSADATPRPATPGTSSGGAIRGQLAFVAGADPQIMLLDLASGDVRQLTTLGPEDAELTSVGPIRPALTCGFGPSGLTWSPDGRLLAFAYGGCDAVVYILDPEGDLQRIGDGRGPTWSPDGSRLLYAANVPYSPCGLACLELPEPGAWDLQVVDIPQGEAPGPLTPDGSTAAAGAPVYSPDGRLIAYAAAPLEPSGGEIFSGTYLVDADGTHLRHVLDGATPFGWHPDGRLLVRSEQDGALHAIQVDSGASERIAGGLQLRSLSPDATLATEMTSDPVSGESAMRLLDIDGELVAELSAHPIAWAPDSSSLAVSVAGAGIAVIGRDGSVLATFETDLSGGGFDGSWRPGS
jgi:Tol biopolymer transport system component